MKNAETKEHAAGLPCSHVPCCASLLSDVHRSSSFQLHFFYEPHHLKYCRIFHSFATTVNIIVQFPPHIFRPLTFYK